MARQTKPQARLISNGSNTGLKKAKPTGFNQYKTIESDLRLCSLLFIPVLFDTLTAACMALPGFAGTATPDQPTHVARRTTTPPTIDGGSY